MPQANIIFWQYGSSVGFRPLLELHIPHWLDLLLNFLSEHAEWNINLR
jgi:hypothetical protein